MNIRSQLFLAFGLVAAIPLVGGAIGFYAHIDAAASAHGILSVGRAARGGRHRPSGAGQFQAAGAGVEKHPAAGA
jgi:hypothetical protein